MIVYFSGTGNSRYCAEYLADLLEDRTLDAFHYIKNNIAADLIDGRPWVFVSPTYAWQIPRIFARFLESAGFAGNETAYFVMTCGSEIGSPTAHNQAICEKKGLHYKGTLQVVMPENYIAMFNAPGKEQARAIIQKAHPVLEEAARCIRQEKDLPLHKTGAIDRIKSGVVNPLFYPLFVKAKKFTVSDSCISCGKCEAACPMGNVTLTDGKPIWGDSCTHCMACICGCPKGAIEYGKISLGKPRYQCPPYKKD